MKPKTKVLGLRLEPDIITDFNNACYNLPLSLNPQKIIKSYMEYIISLNKNIKDSNIFEYGYIVNNSGGCVFVDSKSHIKILKIEGDLFDVKKLS